ncbi:hypothetical protein [Myroides sp. N17-2]|uniref:hypothetical protein n=1 Tax=Myroides sp. N17-2 TaxID=2030799 RepID=UPI000EFD03FC|nr:hypothetical protein [Myroides sp. N17-2]
MNNTNTPEKLKELALSANTPKYDLIISKLEESASKGHNYVLVEDIPELLQAKLIENGYSVKPYFKYKLDLFFRRKKKKFYMIKF